MRRFVVEKVIPIKLILVEEKSLIVKNFNVSFTMATYPDIEEDLISAQINQNVSFSKAVFFLEQIINESIVFEKERADEINKYLVEYENNMIVIPDLSEATLITVLHSKLNAISSENTRVDKIKLIEGIDSITYEYYDDNEDTETSILPSIDEWMGDFSFYEEPWWHRNDQLTWDNAAKDKEEYDLWLERRTSEGFPTSTEAFDEIEERVMEVITSVFKSGEEPKGEIIEVDFANEKRQKWKPTLV